MQEKYKKLTRGIREVNKSAGKKSGALGMFAKDMKMSADAVKRMIGYLPRFNKLTQKTTDNVKKNSAILKDQKQALKSTVKFVTLNAKSVATLARQQKKTSKEVDKLNKGLVKQSRSLETVAQKTERFARKMREGGNAMSNMGRNINRKFTLPLIAGGTVATKMALKADTATKEKLNIVFGELGDNGSKLARKLAGEYGKAFVTMQRAIGSTGDMLVGFGLDQKLALQRTEQIIRRAADQAGFQPEFDFMDIVGRFTKAVTGETESLKPLGIAILQSDKSFRKLMQSYQDNMGVPLQIARSMAILDGIMYQSRQSAGFLKNNWNKLPLVLDRVKEKFVELGTVIGETLIDRFGLGDMLSKLPKQIDRLIKKVENLSDFQIDVIKKATLGLAGLGFATSFVGKTLQTLANMYFAKKVLWGIGSAVSKSKLLAVSLDGIKTKLVQLGTTKMSGFLGAISKFSPHVTAFVGGFSIGKILGEWVKLDESIASIINRLKGFGENSDFKTGTTAFDMSVERKRFEVRNKFF